MFRIHSATDVASSLSDIVRWLMENVPYFHHREKFTAYIKTAAKMLQVVEATGSKVLLKTIGLSKRLQTTPDPIFMEAMMQIPRMGQMPVEIFYKLPGSLRGIIELTRNT